MKIVKLFSLLLALSVLFSGCSASAINDALKNTVKENKDSASQTVVGTYIESEANSEDSSSKTESASDDEKGIGESFEAAIDYETEDGEKVTVGKKGLSYSFNSYEIYDNFFESGLEFRAPMLEYDFETEKYYLPESKENVYKNNMFILVDMSATYNAPENGKEEIIADTYNDIIGWYMANKMPENWLDEFVALRESGTLVTDVQVCYNSLSPLPEDGLYPDHDHMFDLPLKDGESKSFQIGIRCWGKFVEYKNVYLNILNFNPGALEGYDGRYFAVLPEE